MSMFEPWTWRDPAALAGGYSGVPDDEPGGPHDEAGVDRTVDASPDSRTGVDLTGYHVEATDGRIGSVDGASYGDTAHLVVDTGPWIFGRKVLLPAGTVEHVDHQARTVHVDRTKEQVRDSPGYDPDTFGGPDYHHRVGRYYQDTYHR